MNLVLHVLAMVDCQFSTRNGKWLHLVSREDWMTLNMQWFKQNMDREKKRHVTKTGELKTMSRMKRKIGFGDKGDEEEREMDEGQMKQAKKVKEEEEGEEMST